MVNHEDAIKHVLDVLIDEEHGIIKDMSQIDE